MTGIIDFHTHRSAAAALVSVNPRQFDPEPGLYYSVGFHPWNDVQALTDDDFLLLERCARHPQVLAVGETGLDRLRGASINIQADVFLRHLLVARAVGKPVVVHCVKTAQEILAVRRKAGLTGVTLAIHGMRYNERVARGLLDAGCYLSYGQHFNEAAVMATPLDRLLIETDEAPVSIQDVAAQVARARGIAAPELMELAAANARRLLFPAND